MRKRLVALLSLVGFTGSGTPAATQVQQGSSQGAETKSESQVKLDKAAKENAASQTDASKKLRKAGGEQKAAQDVVNEKVGPDHIVHKHIAGVKYEDRAAHKTNKANKANLDAASKDAAKLTKATNEGTVAQEDPKKRKAVTAEANAVKNDAGKKLHKAGKEQQDAITIKQKTVSGKTSDSSQKVLIGLSEPQKNDAQKKALKNAAESNAAQQSVEKKTDKATPK